MVGRESALSWLTISFGSFTTWWSEATPLEAMSFAAMAVGAVGVFHSGWVKHQRLNLDRRNLGKEVEEDENKL